MITEWILQLSNGFLSWLASLFPTYTPPSWLSDPGGWVAQLTQTVAGLGYWVNFPAIAGIVTLTLTLYITAFGFKLARAVAAHVPFIGGNG